MPSVVRSVQLLFNFLCISYRWPQWPDPQREAHGWQSMAQTLAWPLLTWWTMWRWQESGAPLWRTDTSSLNSKLGFVFLIRLVECFSFVAGGCFLKFDLILKSEGTGLGVLYPKTGGSNRGEMDKVGLSVNGTCVSKLAMVILHRHFSAVY